MVSFACGPKGLKCWLVNWHKIMTVPSGTRSTLPSIMTGAIGFSSEAFDFCAQLQIAVSRSINVIKDFFIVVLFLVFVLVIVLVLIAIEVSNRILKLRFMVVSANGLTTDLQRYYNGLTAMTLIGFRFHGAKVRIFFEEM